MDALIRRFSGLSLITLALALGGCQSPAKKQTAADFDAMGREELNAALALQPQSNSIVREGDYVTYVVMELDGHNTRHLVRFDADCHLPDAQMAHLTSGGMLQFAVDRKSATAEGRQMPGAEKQLFLQSAQLKQVCAQTPVPQWRVIAAPQQQDWQLLDRASLIQKDGQTLFWSARVPAAEALMPRLKGLYSQVRQRWSADCAQQRLTSLSTFYLDKNNRVIGGAMVQQPTALQTLDADARQLLILACGTQQALDQYKPFPGRAQTAFVLPDPELPASVVKSIEALKLPAPEKDITQLRISFKDFNEAHEQALENKLDLSILKSARRRELGRLGRDTRYQPYEPGKQLIERYDGQTRQAVKVSFRGLIKLASVDYTNDHYGIRVSNDGISDLRFEGDWMNMPVGAHLAYTVQWSFAPYKKDAPQRLDAKFACQVESLKPASEFYPSLSGTAKVITCTGENETAMYAYLQTYGLFVPVDAGSKFGYGQFKIEAAE